MKLTGTAGPIDANDAALTPLNAKINVQKMNLAASGFIDPAAGIQGLADLNGTIVSNGNEAKANGTLTCSKLQVVKKGAPAGQPVKVDFTVVHNLVRETGNITRGDISMGKAVSHLTGTYDAHGKVTSVNLKLNGQNMPVEPFLRSRVAARVGSRLWITNTLFFIRRRRVGAFRTIALI